MSVHLPLFKDKSELPTKKCHISFSEAHTSTECSYKHKLKYINGLGGEDTEHTLYGRCLHDALEDWLLKKDSIEFFWEERIEQCYAEVLEKLGNLPNFKPSEEEFHTNWLEPIDFILRRVPGWMDETFPGWKTVAAEFPLFEPIPKEKNKWFKGFIDCVIKVPKTPRKGSKKPAEGSVYWILDWKTTSWGWDTKKKQDKFKRAQLALYKHYFSVKTGIPLEDIKCGFVLLKRTAKKERCELVEVSVGDKTRQDALDMVSTALGLIRKGLWVKNRYSCMFCDFSGTPHCV